MEHLFAIKYSYLIPLLPLIGAAVAGLGCTGRRKRHAHWPIWIGVLASAVLATMLAAGMLAEQRRADGAILLLQKWFTWIQTGNFSVNAGFLFDPLTAVMLCVVCGIGFLICVYAAGYMHGEQGYFRFFAYMGLFIFMMSILVMSENLVMLYLGWEGVGLCSYLLIGYYYEKPSAREAAKKAFLVNRVGDFGFALGIMLSFYAFGTVSYFADGKGLLELAGDPNHPGHWAVKYIPFLLMLGALGKSAQFPLYVWLPDAMEGPTPVSALIHAATMVTAGVYMIARCSALFVASEVAMTTVAVIGAFTALFAATIALRQFDLKKVFAYSTISQLGFMFVGVGVLAPVAGVFHLVTHAFFKALLFLSSGVVMHAMGGELDMRKMSGLKSVLPKTRWLMLIGCCALAGIPFFSGFFSKDEIIAGAWEHSRLLALVLLATAFLTAYYTFRLYFRVFEGPTITPEHAHAEAEHGHHHHEPAVMILPLVLLAVGAVAAGYLNWPGERLKEFLAASPSIRPLLQAEPLDKHAREALQMLHRNLMLLSGAIGLGGVLAAYWIHLKHRDAEEKLVRRFPRTARVLDRKYWVDEIYQAGIVQPLRWIGRAFFAVDRWVVDGVVELIGFVPQFCGAVLRLTTQRGHLQGYAAAMLLGMLLILLLILL